MANRETDQYTPYFGQRAAEVKNSGELSEVQKRFIELDRFKDQVKAFFDDYNQAVRQVVSEIGVGAFFQDETGIVYKTVKPTGTFVSFQEFAIDHTRREGQTKGSLAMKEAKEAGYTVPENKPEKVEAVTA